MGMPTLKNMVQVVNLAPGIPTTYAHALQDTDGRALLPDHVYAPTNESLEVTAADATNITVINRSATNETGSVLVESWHTENRVFPGTALTLAGLPYIVNSLAGGSTADRLSIGQQQAPPAVITQRFVYANAAGSDATGDGSVGNPYRTFLRAMQDVPLNIRQPEEWIVDITDLGVENFVGHYNFPQFIGWQGFVRNAFSDPSFIADTFGDVTIRATPTAVLDIPAANITGQVADATTGHITVQTNLALIAGAHVGQIIQGAGLLETYVVVSNNVTDIETTARAAFTPDIQLQTQSATLRNGNAADFNTTIHVRSARANIVFAGINIDHASANPSHEALHVSSSMSTVEAVGCAITGISQTTAVLQSFSCYLTRAVRVTGPYYGSTADFMDAVEFVLEGSSHPYGELQIINGIIDSAANGLIVGPLSGLMDMRNMLIRSSVGIGVSVMRGHLTMTASKIENCGGIGIIVGEGAYASLNGITGIGNVGVGVSVQDGAQVQAAGAMAITGAGDYQCGGNAASAAGGAGWAALIIAVSEDDLAAGVPEICRIYV